MKGKKGRKMIKQKLTVEGIPAVLWGKESKKVFIAVHGNMSHKEDIIIMKFAEKAVSSGYQVLSFDLPEHGDRKNEDTLCKVQECVSELTAIINYIKERYENVSLFACSMGAYFSLMAYKNEKLSQSLFLSPVVNMGKIIDNMMLWFDISEERLEKEKEIMTPIGQKLYWDYYCYVRSHLVTVWDIPTSILYGSKDDVCEYETILHFTEIFHCNLYIMDNSGHFFHTNEQLEFFDNWLDKSILS